MCATDDWPFQAASRPQSSGRPLVQVPPDNPDGFVRALLFEPEARLGYLYDVLATASPAARAFALGPVDRRRGCSRPPLPGTRKRGRVRRSVSGTSTRLPFARPLNELAILLLRMHVGADGAPSAPAHRRFWSAALDASPLLDDKGEGAPASHVLVDAAWLLGATAGDMYTRGDRLESGRRSVSACSERAPERRERHGCGGDPATCRRDACCCSALERIGITDPDVYVAGERQSRAAMEGEPSASGRRHSCRARWR